MPDVEVTETFKEEMLLSIDAAARADARSALQHYRASGPLAPVMVPELDIIELVDLGDEAPSWTWSRWIARVAFRWMLTSLPDQRVDAAVVSTLDALYPHLDLSTMQPDAFRETGTGLVAGNRLTEQLAVYEFGGLAAFLRDKAEPQLIERCDSARRWGHMPMRAYRLAGMRRDRMLAVDLTDGSEVQLLNLGALTDRDYGDHVLGRVVPTEVVPGRLFAARPFDIDAKTARDIGRLGKSDSLEWLGVLRDGVAAGRVDPVVFWDGCTPLGSDIVYQQFHASEAFLGDEDDPDNWPRRKQDLVAAGVSPSVADGVMVCEVGLIGVEVSGDKVAAGLPHVASVLSQRAVFQAALQHACRPEHAAGWARIAELVPEPARSRARLLSERALGAA